MQAAAPTLPDAVQGIADDMKELALLEGVDEKEVDGLVAALTNVKTAGTGTEGGGAGTSKGAGAGGGSST